MYVMLCVSALGSPFPRSASKSLPSLSFSAARSKLQKSPGQPSTCVEPVSECFAAWARAARAPRLALFSRVEGRERRREWSDSRLGSWPSCPSSPRAPLFPMVRELIASLYDLESISRRDSRCERSGPSRAMTWRGPLYGSAAAPAPAPAPRFPLLLRSDAIEGDAEVYSAAPP